MLSDDGGRHPGAESAHAGGVQTREEAIHEPGRITIPCPACVHRFAARPKGWHHLHPNCVMSIQSLSLQVSIYAKNVFVHVCMIMQIFTNVLANV
jgi:hypothetical protein